MQRGLMQRKLLKELTNDGGIFAESWSPTSAHPRVSS
jgi:hypothetical protein